MAPVGGNIAAVCRRIFAAPTLKTIATLGIFTVDMLTLYERFNVINFYYSMNGNAAEKQESLEKNERSYILCCIQSLGHVRCSDLCKANKRQDRSFELGRFIIFPTFQVE